MRDEWYECLLIVFRVEINWDKKWSDKRIYKVNSCCIDCIENKKVCVDCERKGYVNIEF